MSFPPRRQTVSQLHLTIYIYVSWLLANHHLIYSSLTTYIHCQKDVRLNNINSKCLTLMKMKYVKMYVHKGDTNTRYRKIISKPVQICNECGRRDVSGVLYNQGFCKTVNESGSSSKQIMSLVWNDSWPYLYFKCFQYIKHSISDVQCSVICLQVSPKVPLLLLPCSINSKCYFTVLKI